MPLVASLVLATSGTIGQTVWFSGSGHRSVILPPGLRYRLNMADPERDPDTPRRVGLRAFNKTKSFFNEHDMIFEKIDLESDIGIDAILTFARRGPDAGRFVNVQVKGGKTYKRATHIDEFYSKYRGMASLRSTDWRLWKEIEPPRGYERHHIVDVDAG
jgi:Domain of unknown function (DUF4365)